MRLKKQNLSLACVRLCAGGILLLLVASSAHAQHSIDVQKLNAQSRHFAALTEYKKMPKRRATLQARASAAQSAWALGLLDQAAAEFDSILVESAEGSDFDLVDRARVLLARGIIEYQQGRYQVAIVYARKMIKQLSLEGPLKSQAWFLWGESLFELGKYEASEKRYLKALKLTDTENKAGLHLALAQAQFKLGKYERAKANFEAVPLTHQSSPEAIRYLAQIGLETENYESAVFWLETGRREFKQDFLDSWVDYALVKAAIQQGDLKRMRQLRKHANETHPPSDRWFILLDAAAESFEASKTSFVSSN